MNRFIAKLLGGINAVVWVLLGVVIPLGYMSLVGGSAGKEPVIFFGVILGCVLGATVVCGGIALLVRIADSLDAIREGMAPAGPVLATVGGTGYAKCPSCGDLNAQGADVCRACGKAMAA